MSKRGQLVDSQVKKYEHGELPPIPDDLPEDTEYPEFVRSMNIIDIVHQIEVVLYRDPEMVREFNQFYRSSLGPMLLHADKTGKYNVSFAERQGE